MLQVIQELFFLYKIIFHDNMHVSSTVYIQSVGLFVNNKYEVMTMLTAGHYDSAILISYHYLYLQYELINEII